MKRRYARIEADYLTARVAALPKDTEHPLGAVMIQDAAHGNTLQKIFRRQQAAQRDWYSAIETLTRLQATAATPKPTAGAKPPPSAASPPESGSF